MSSRLVDFKQQQAYHDRAPVGCRSQRPSETLCGKDLPIIGPSNETNVIISNQPCTALLDTGSSVSTIGKSFYDKHLSSNHPMHTLDNLLQVESAGGHILPYLGFIMVEIVIPGGRGKVPCILLIVPDTTYHKCVPVLLGTNTLVSVMKQLELTYGVRYLQRADLSTSWQLAIRCLNIRTKTVTRSEGKLCIIKSAASGKITLPGNTTITVIGSLDKKINVPNCMAIMQQVTESKLPSDVEVVPGLVSYDEHLQTVKVCMSNHSASSLVISPKAIICQLQICEVIDPDDEDLPGPDWHILVK